MRALLLWICFSVLHVYKHRYERQTTQTSKPKAKGDGGEQVILPDPVFGLCGLPVFGICGFSVDWSIDQAALLDLSVSYFK